MLVNWIDYQIMGMMMSSLQYNVTVRFETWAFQLICGEEEIKDIWKNFDKGRHQLFNDNGKIHYINYDHVLMIEVTPIAKPVTVIEDEKDTGDHVDGINP